MPFFPTIKENVSGEAFSITFMKVHSSFQNTTVFLRRKGGCVRIALVKKSWKFLVMLYILYRYTKSSSSFKLPSPESDPLFCVVSSVMLTWTNQRYTCFEQRYTKYTCFEQVPVRGQSDRLRGRTGQKQVLCPSRIRIGLEGMNLPWKGEEG